MTIKAKGNLPPQLTPPLRTGGDPFPQQLDLLRRKWRTWRHSHITLVPHCLKQETLFRLARGNHGAVPATLQQTVAIIERNPAIVQVMVVATQTSLSQNWSNASIEEAPRIGRAPECE